MRHDQQPDNAPDPVIVVSPHLDDAVLSCGSLLAAVAYPSLRRTPESTAGNLIVGPFVAIADRVRDALRARSA